MDSNESHSLGEEDDQLDTHLLDVSNILSLIMQPLFMFMNSYMNNLVLVWTSAHQHE